MSPVPSERRTPPTHDATDHQRAPFGPAPWWVPLLVLFAFLAVFAGCYVAFS